MAPVKLSDAQRCLLLCIDEFAEPGDGWGEVELQYFIRRPLPEKFLSNETPTARIVANALRRRGLIYEHGGPELTQAGRDVLMTGRLDWRPDGTECPPF